MEKSYFKIAILISIVVMIVFSLYKFNFSGMRKFSHEISTIFQQQASVHNPAYNFLEQNLLGENFIRDFYRYECKSIKRFGSSHSDSMYRMDGKYLNQIIC